MTRSPIDDLLLMDDLKETVKQLARAFDERRYKDAFALLEQINKLKALIEDRSSD